MHSAFLLTHSLTLSFPPSVSLTLSFPPSISLTLSCPPSVSLKSGLVSFPQLLISPLLHSFSIVLIFTQLHSFSPSILLTLARQHQSPSLSLNHFHPHNTLLTLFSLTLSFPTLVSLSSDLVSFRQSYSTSQSPPAGSLNHILSQLRSLIPDSTLSPSLSLIHSYPHSTCSLTHLFLCLPHSTEYKECQAFCPSVRIGSPPLTCKRLLPPTPLDPRGATRLLAGEGVGYPIQATGEKLLCSVL